MIPDPVPLIVSADEGGIHWRTALHRAINSEQPVFAVLEVVARLISKRKHSPNLLTTSPVVEPICRRKTHE